MLVSSVFEFFDSERYSLQRSLVLSPEKEIVLEHDNDCRKNITLFDRAYKCIYCHNIGKIARFLPCFTIEIGDKKGKEYIIEKTNHLAHFTKIKEKVYFYDNFRGAYAISVLLNAVEIPTFSYILCSFYCSGGCSIYEKFIPLEYFDLNLAKQLIFTLSFMENYAFVFDELEFYVAQEEVNIEYDNLKISSSVCLKLRAFTNASISYGKNRLISGNNFRKTVLREVKNHCFPQTQEFHYDSVLNDKKHLGFTELNIYLAMIKLRPFMTQDVMHLWKTLWKEEEYFSVEKEIFSEEFSLERYTLRKGVLRELLVKVSS